MSIHLLISKIPYFRQACVITFSPHQVIGENIRTGERCCFPRSSKHPRTLAGDFFSLEEELKKAISELVPRKWIKSKILICLDGLNEGGYTNIEKRAFREAGMGTGAMEVYLSDQIISHSQAFELLVNGGTDLDNA
ncbi:hypothetical protein [Shewanella colwelliana]|uniref:hypothetical protein n=1 Tax=Shewanella colwelliana TaxID=23 RepID=UPI00299F37C9|nr:hypothetical protein [Shewanella colwelliana]MDX1279652.1 hypothetical protein [Shewanella colwelliana]